MVDLSIKIYSTVEITTFNRYITCKWSMFNSKLLVYQRVFYSVGVLLHDYNSQIITVLFQPVMIHDDVFGLTLCLLCGYLALI